MSILFIVKSFGSILSYVIDDKHIDHPLVERLGAILPKGVFERDSLWIDNVYTHIPIISDRFEVSLSEMIGNYSDDTQRLRLKTMIVSVLPFLLIHGEDKAYQGCKDLLIAL